ncbi:hypothetical protein GCM10022225_22030 [Plantactinospora mayteni]|uniref:DUF4246 domain-containing protein n=1 Tax=Plantactinospora mayteni TaxID=566021 RepID=A0ABQ4ENY8_9ACTN|nr:DUF4246 domain-containing protein [Plantactinospora mayteni]GIG96384.1 hypothetical protein Pma05_29570 [Plantactinospora mayteni]
MTELSAFPLPFRASHRDPVVAPRTLRELQMMQLSAHIRAKPQWFVKMSDVDLVARWTREAAAQGLTEAEIRYVFAELAYYAELRDKRTGIEVSTVDGVWQSDTLIDNELRSRLREAVRVLEEVPDAEQDWHPGSNEQVLDLVHPSLFCLVRQVSRMDDAAWQSPGIGRARYAHSEKFQWLPTDVEVGDDGNAVFAAYVNNVHPVAHRELDSILPVLFARMRPLFENVLTDLRHPRPLRIEVNPFNWYDDDPKKPVEPSDDDGEAWDTWYEAMHEWRNIRRPVVPDAPVFSPPALPDNSARVDLRARRLQVIVKLANIHLTPDKPEYPGGTWHVEGMMNERIVSTGIYYWDSENTTDSQLSFRAAIAHPDYEQNDADGLRDVYGLNDEDPLNQALGSVQTRAGRCLAFPNILQHRVSPFRLADPTRPGHRKILAFFLIDPSVTIVSTSDVPPQQPWSSTSTMTLDQAKGYREQLMQERKFFVDEHNEELYEREFSLCEH